MTNRYQTEYTVVTKTSLGLKSIYKLVQDPNKEVIVRIKPRTKISVKKYYVKDFNMFDFENWLAAETVEDLNSNETKYTGEILKIENQGPSQSTWSTIWLEIENKEDVFIKTVEKLISRREYL